MTMTLEEICTEAINLPGKSRVLLADRIVESIGETIDPQVTQSHLHEVKRRRDEIRSGKVTPINGEEGLARVRAIIGG